MIDVNRAHPLMRYQITVGHSRVFVWSATRQQAIQEARIKLSLEMPRLYDVIHAMDESRFVVKSDEISQ